MPPNPLPRPVVEMLSSRRHRLRHFLWHSVRGAWNNPNLTDDARALIKTKGWAPPDGRAPFDAKGKLILDNHSGEDFLYMHRQMITEVNELLALLQDPAYPRITPWESIPGPDGAFPVPPAWTHAHPGMTPEQNAATTARLQRVKSPAFFERTFRTWENFFTDPINLQRLTLGALGNLLEMTVHNNLHMRWAAEPVGYRPEPSLTAPGAIDPRWDKPDYDYLGDTYSSHVNAHFWYLHGWVDRCIDRWQKANGVDEIEWKGTWTGKLEDGWHHGHGFFGLQQELAAGHHPGHHPGPADDVAEMELLAKSLGECGVIRNFYDSFGE